jgi:hypothetical protein
LENLQDGFAALMEERSINIHLDPLDHGIVAWRKTEYGDNSLGNFHGVESLEPKTLELIRKVYQKDFELGGYSLDVLDAHKPPMPSSSSGISSGPEGTATKKAFWELPCTWR